MLRMGYGVAASGATFGYFSFFFFFKSLSSLICSFLAVRISRKLDTGGLNQGFVSLNVASDDDLFLCGLISPVD